MDFTARLKKKHILDLIAFLRTTHKTGRMGEDDLSEDSDKGKNDYREHCLFLGLMPNEDGSILVMNEAEK